MKGALAATILIVGLMMPHVPMQEACCRPSSERKTWPWQELAGRRGRRTLPTLFKNPAGMSRLEGNHFQGGWQALYFAAFHPHGRHIRRRRRR